MAAEFGGGRQATDIANWVNRKLQGAVTFFSTAEALDQWVKQNDGSAVVGFFSAKDASTCTRLSRTLYCHNAHTHASAFFKGCCVGSYVYILCTWCCFARTYTTHSCSLYGTR